MRAAFGRREKKKFKRLKSKREVISKNICWSFRQDGGCASSRLGFLHVLGVARDCTQFQCRICFSASRATGVGSCVSSSSIPHDIYDNN